MNRTKLTAIDLCSGPGGVTTGYRAAGVRVLAAVDIDPEACETYAANHRRVKLLREDLSKLEPAALMKAAGIKPGELDILTACVPCQTFSSLARVVRSSDPRNRLVLRVSGFVAAIRPRAVVMENVPGLLEQHRFTLLVARLRKLGYGVRFGVVDAANFGVPQRRRRLVLIALLGVADEDVPELDPGAAPLRRFSKPSTVRDALRLVRERAKGDPLAKPKTDYPDIVARRIAAIPANGGSRGSLDSELELKCHSRLTTSGAGSSYGRMTYDDVAPTLTTRCVTPACGRYLHPRANRAISLREAACLQTFPVRYRFRGGAMSIQGQIGNAVPPRLAQAIAKLVSHELAPPKS